MANIKRANASGITKTGSAISDVPDAPIIGAISDPGTDGYASVAFTAAATGGAVTTFTATSTPGSITGTSATSPITVTGLTLNTAYTFKVKGTNSTATGPESSASSSFTPTAHTSYESIATVSVSSDVSSISFDSIPSTYSHLQIRFISKDSNATNGLGSSIRIKMNDDSVAGNYYGHRLLGDGGGAYATSFSGSSTGALVGEGMSNGASSYNLSAGVIDILDYKNTNKYKTVRTLGGGDTNTVNGSGIYLYSGLWKSTSTITKITLVADSYNWKSPSHFALYGIKGA